MRNLFALIMAAAFLISCEQETDKVNEIIYFPLEIGNYWIYQHYDIDSSGNETQKSLMDSILITRDTIINGNQYFVLQGTYYPYTHNHSEIVFILRDSAGYILNEKGTIMFSENNFTDTLVNYYYIEQYSGDTIYNSIAKMEKVDEPVIVPAGTFSVLNYKRSIYTSQKYAGLGNPRNMNTYYAEKTGIILDTYFYLQDPGISEKRLVRYHIEE